LRFKNIYTAIIFFYLTLFKIKLFMKLSYFLGLLGLTATLGVVSCKPVISDPVEPFPTNNANVLTINAAPETSGLDMVVGSVKHALNLVFQGSTGYMRIPTNSSMDFNKAGTSEKVFGGTENLIQDKNYSAFLCSELTPQTGNVATTTLRRFVLSDDLSQPRDSFAKIRFVHTVADLPAGEVYLQDNEVPVPAVKISGTTNTGFKQATDFAEVRVVFSGREDTIRKALLPPNTPLVNGIFDLKFVEPGLSPLDMPLPITLKNQQIYTIYLSGFKNAYMIGGKPVGGTLKFINLTNK
jgi:Domain of unknown function (DUF4397)